MGVFCNRKKRFRVLFNTSSLDGASLSRRLYFGRLKAFDWISLLVVLISIIASAQLAYGQKSRGTSVSVQSPSSEWLYPLNVNRVANGFGPEGTCVIAIQDSTAFVKESDCPENICVRMGRITRQNEWIACVPHRIFITIKGQTPNQIDDYSYRIVSTEVC